jgi:tRNA nucleotidyltransferase (CCA-adding enzyme)
MLGDTLLGDAAAERERRRQTRQTSTSPRTLLTVVWLQLHLQEVVEDAVFIQLSRARRRQSSAHRLSAEGFHTLSLFQIDSINVELLSDTASTFV